MGEHAEGARSSRARTGRRRDGRALEQGEELRQRDRRRRSRRARRRRLQKGRHGLRRGRRRHPGHGPRVPGRPRAEPRVWPASVGLRLEGAQKGRGWRCEESTAARGGRGARGRGWRSLRRRGHDGGRVWRAACGEGCRRSCVERGPQGAQRVHGQGCSEGRERVQAHLERSQRERGEARPLRCRAARDALDADRAQRIGGRVPSAHGGEKSRCGEGGEGLHTDR